MCVYVQKKSKFLVQERYADSQTVEIAKRGTPVWKKMTQLTFDMVTCMTGSWEMKERDIGRGVRYI